MIMGIAETEETIKRVPEFDLQSPIQWILDQIVAEKFMKTSTLQLSIFPVYWLPKKGSDMFDNKRGI